MLTEADRECHGNVFAQSRACTHQDNSSTGEVPSVPALNQYPDGTHDLWMAHYRKDPNGGDMNGPTAKLDGTLQEAAAEAQCIAEREGYILQCLRRRF